MPDRLLTRSRAAAAVLLLGAVLGLAGCSGEHDGTPEETGAAPSQSSQSSQSSSPTPTDAASVPPAAESAVPAPTQGAGETVPTGAQRPALEVAPGSAADLQPGLTVRLGDVDRTEGEASAPGEVSGPAVRVEVRLDNGSGEPVDPGLVVALSYGPDATPAPRFLDGSEPVGDRLDAGARAAGVYVFAVPDDVDTVRVQISAGGHRPVAFEESP